jgi:hypothetical protein
MTKTYVLRVISSRTAVKSQSSISSEWNSPRTLEHECLNALMSSDVLSYRVGSRELGGLDSPSSAATSRPEASVASVEGEEDVAMTRNVVRSKRITSVALHALAKVVRCFARMLALGMRVCTMFDHACRCHEHLKDMNEIQSYLVKALIIDTRSKHPDRKFVAVIYQVLLLCVERLLS